MAFTVSFRTQGPPLSRAELEEWLTEQAEPFEEEGPEHIALRALDVLLVMAPGQPLQAQLTIETNAPLSRLVDLLFALSVRAGADVKLAGVGEVDRARLWLVLADEQDRQRLAESIKTASLHGCQDDVLNGLWRLLAAVRPGKDHRWDIDRERIVEMKIVGESISAEEAAWHTDDTTTGEYVPFPVTSGELFHIVAWRWMNETWPGVAEATHY